MLFHDHLVAVTEIEKPWRMPDGLHGLLIPLSRVRIPPGRPLSARSSAVEREPSVEHSSPWNLFDAGECRRDYRVEHLREQEAGGSSPPSERSGVAQENVSPTIRRQHQHAVGGCRRDYIGKGRKAERFDSAPGLVRDVSPNLAAGT